MLRSLKDVWRLISGKRGDFWRAIVFSLIGSILILFFPMAIRHAVNSAILATGGTAEDRIATLLGICFVALLLVVVGSAFEYGSGRLLRIAGIRLSLRLRRRLFKGMLRMPPAFFGANKTGGLTSVLSSDVNEATACVENIAIPVIEITKVGMIFCWLFSINWKLACGAVPLVLGSIAINYIISRRMHPLWRDVFEFRQQADGRLVELLSGVRVIRAFRAEGKESLYVARNDHRIARTLSHATGLAHFSGITAGLLAVLTNLIVVVYGGYLLIAGAATYGDLMAFQVYLFMLLSPMIRIATSIGALQRGTAALERLSNLQKLLPDAPREVTSGAAPVQFESLIFNDVSFSHGHGGFSLNNISFKITCGMHVACVGASGSGKSTLLDLIARLQTPTGGTILLNGKPASNVSLEGYFGMLGIVQQEPFLFDGTILENVLYGVKSHSESSLREAVEFANLQFVEELPSRWNTRIGERGVCLSMGQRQRISIARTYLTAPQILLLDEPTSSLDAESEHSVQLALQRISLNRTVFVVAHRLQTILSADMIFVMDKGRIVESGVHQDLILADGYYSRLYRRQTEMLLGPRS